MPAYLTSVLASDFTGIIEIMAWGAVNLLFAIGLVVCWLLLAIPKFREVGRNVIVLLCFSGLILGLILAVNFQTMILHNHRNEWDEFAMISGVSLLLFSASAGTFYFANVRSKDKR